MIPLSVIILLTIAVFSEEQSSAVNLNNLKVNVKELVVKFDLGKCDTDDSFYSD